MSFGLPNVDLLFEGFKGGDFGVIYGSPDCLWLSQLLCVRCQLPDDQLPNGSPSLFIDGGNTFDLYGISRIAKSYQLQPKQVLNNIYISRAFTAYQLTSLIFEKLEPALDKFGAKLVVIANVPWLYLDRDVPKTESQDVFNKLTQFLSKFAQEKKIIVVATYSTGRPWSRMIFYEAALTGRTSVVIKTAKSKDGLKLTLEKHPTHKTGFIIVPPEGIKLTDFSEES